MSFNKKLMVFHRITASNKNLLESQVLNKKSTVFEEF